jgi:cell division protein FtsI/penicillin-binding protein 2
MPLTKKNITNKLYLLSLFLVLISFFIVFKLVDLQISKGDYYINISENREFKNIEIPANRGNIYSDSGELLQF